jgi:hypothetical protein
MNSFATMSAGWGEFQNFLAGGLGTIRRVVFSFPSLYELLPSYEKCCRFGDEDKYTTFDPADAKVWTDNDWIPAEHRGARLALIEKAMSQAKRLRTLMRQPLPANIEVTMIAADRFSTHYYLYVDPEKRNWTSWRFSKARGDGTVPVWSAANKDDDIGDSLPAFVDHATIFNDKWIVSLLERKLNRRGDPPPVSGQGAPRVATKSGKTAGLVLVDATFEPPVAVLGDQTRFDLIVSLADRIEQDDLAPLVSLQTPSEQRDLVLQNVTTQTDLERRVLKFTTSFEAKDSGPHSALISFSGAALYSKDILVVDR